MSICKKKNIRNDKQRENIPVALSGSCKLLFITYEFGKFINGGVGRVINGLTGKMAGAMDFDIFLLNSHPAGTGWNSRLFRVRKGKCRKKGRYCSCYMDKLNRLIQEEKYHIIHFLHSGDKAAAIMKNIRKLYPAVRLLYSCHSISRFDRQIRNTCLTNVESEDFIINACDHLHLLNRTSLELLNRTYPAVTGITPVTIIPNGINECDFYKKSFRMKNKLAKKINRNEFLTIVCMTRWSYGKGLEVLLDAVSEVLKTEKGIKFIVAGKKQRSWESGYAEYLELLEHKIRAAGENVITLGWLDDKERNALYAFADIWVMPSLLEYFPYSILEPAICGIPIISSRIDSVTELFEENKECIFFEPCNAFDLACRIIHLAGNRELRQALKQAAYNKLKCSYDWDTVSGMYLNMYSSVLQNGKFDY